MRIVLSYRKSDTADITDRIFDELSAHFKSDSVFMNVDSIPFGIDFSRHIQKKLEGCDVLLTIIGSHWLGEDNDLRINEETDFVRLEVETALQHDIPVFPVLVDGAKMPKPGQLPEALRNLAFRIAASVDSGRDFHLQVDRIIRSLDHLGKGLQAARRKAEQEEVNQQRAFEFETINRQKLDHPIHVQEEALQRVEQEGPPSAEPRDTPVLTPEQMVNLGIKYQSGQGVTQDFAEALRWFRMAADLGNADAMSHLGWMYRVGRDLIGQGVPKDYTEALRWSRMAAYLGNTTAMFTLGLMYERGDGVIQDFAEALRWFRMAADLGNTDAMYHLGWMYELGDGVAKSRSEALTWYQKAANLDDRDAKEAVIRLTAKSWISALWSKWPKKS